MSKVGRRLFTKKRRASATFHVDEDFGASWRRRNRPQRLGLARTLMTGLTLSFAGATVFVALHYVPAKVSPTQIMRVSDLDETMLSDRATGFMSLIAPYWDSLQSRRTYVRAGDTVEVQYRIDGGQTLDLVVERCARQWVREVFNCNVEAQQVVRVDRRRGHHRFQFNAEGFYRFREVQSQESRVIWRRV